MRDASGAGPADIKGKEPLGLHIFGSNTSISQSNSQAGTPQSSARRAANATYAATVGSAFHPVGGFTTNSAGSSTKSRGKMRASQRQPAERSLDGFFILRATGVDYPHELSTARLQHCGLTRSNSSDLAEFTNLAHLDVSGNALRFEDLQTFPRLEVLEIALNGITTLDPGVGFTSLTILDLSYNNITPEAILNLGSLPALKSLDMSNNGLARLPLSMAASASEATESSFAVLETLNLDDNKLTSPGVFQAVAGLPRLQVLDLNRNMISFVPQLVPSIPDGVEVALDPNAIKPFAALQVLGLTENRIAHAEDVLTVASWDGIEAMHLWGNPIVTQKSQLPPELSEELRRRETRGQPALQVPRTQAATLGGGKPTIAESMPPQDVITIAPLVLPQIVRGGALREYLAEKAQQQYLEYTTSRPASTAGPLPPIGTAAPEEADVYEEDEDEDGTGFFLTEMAAGGGGGADEAMAPPPFDVPVLAPGEDFEVDHAAAQRMGIMTPSATTDLESLGRTAPSTYGGILPSVMDDLDEDSAAANFGDDSASHADAGAPERAIVPYAANIPHGVKEEFKELFREDTEEEAALGPIKYVPESIKASTQALRFALQHPLTLVFDRKPPKKESQLALASNALSETREWSTQNLQDALNSLS